MATTHPELAAQWHPTKNGNLKPTDVKAGSNKSAWWMCDQGHEWRAIISSRGKDLKPCGCPVCSGQKVLAGFNDLATTHPELAAQWHPTKNGDLKPTDVTVGSAKQIWWCCDAGHPYKSKPFERKRGRGCPYCSRKAILIGYNDLATTHPELAAQWHPTKNGDLKPMDVTAGSKKKVWWKCEKGHDWQTVVYSRTGSKPTGCPICTGRKVLAGFNDLSALRPDLCEEWDFEINIKGPEEYTEYSNDKVAWVCKVCGNRWYAQISSRSAGTGCRNCCRQQISKNEAALAYYIEKVTPIRRNEMMPFLSKSSLDIYAERYSIAVEYDGVYFHSDKQEHDLMKNKLCMENGIKLFRVRERGLPEVDGCRTVYVDRTSVSMDSAIKEILEEIEPGSTKFVDVNTKRDMQDILCTRHINNCEKSFGTMFPELLSSWDYELNKISPYEVDPHSNDRFHWKCPECGYRWMAVLSSRTGRMRAGCPCCAGRVAVSGYNDLVTTNPRIVAEWSPKNKKSPCEYTRGSHSKVIWKCPDCGLEYEAEIKSRTLAGTGCPCCAGKRPIVGSTDFASTFPEIATQWHPTKNGDLKPTDVTVGSGKKVWWRCEKGHEWQAIVYSRTKGRGCPYCSGKRVLVEFNDLATTHQELAAQWHPTKNGDLKPTDVTRYSHKDIWWKCEKGHEWHAKLNSRKNAGCPECKRQSF